LPTFNDIIENLALRAWDMFGVDRGRVKPYTVEDRMEDREW